MASAFYYGIDQLDVARAMSLATGGLQGLINDAAQKKIQRSQEYISQMVAADATVYGVTTGFGILANTKISKEDTALLQYKILQSHSVGVGAAIPNDVVRLMLTTKVHALAQGFSGVQLSTIERMLWHLKNDVIPVVPEKGSVGASGDLAPLAHLFLPLIGLGEVVYEGKTFKAYELLKKFELAPINLAPKEGLALINGTQFILAYAVRAVQRLQNCLDAADIIGAMSLEALTGTKAPFDDRLHQLRPFEGNMIVARRLNMLLDQSAIM